MSLSRLVSTPLTSEVRKETFEIVKEYLQSQFNVNYDTFEMIYEKYYFISRPTREDKEILELLSQYEEYIKKYWDAIEMPVNEQDKDEEDDEEVFAEHPLYKIAR